MSKVKIFLKEEKKITSTVIISFAFCILFIFTNRIPELFKYGSELMSFVYAISISIIAAFIFYVFNIYLPERKRKDLIKHNLEEQYLSFKEESIDIFLRVLENTDSEESAGKLYDLNEFKKYFKKKYDKGQDRWDKVATELDSDKTFLKDLIVQLNILRDEVSFVLNNIKINDKDVFLFFKRLSKIVYGYALSDINIDYDEKKLLMKFLWELFSGWDFSYGYREEDIVKLMIEKI